MARLSDCRTIVDRVYQSCLKEATPEQKMALAIMYKTLRRAFSSKRRMRTWLMRKVPLTIPLHAQPGFEDLPPG